ncbi:apolipoprotein N-acyltransferase [Dasania marina]|uniref:apolipoprotein N-acyltransferase n=1 Tax=Dasania marina TaxID=471499 RepID=UPI00037F26D9|nr:apolipoprotein N-acyltransferase [Dasania marina]
MPYTTRTQGWLGHLAALLAGGLITLSLAPFNYWPLGIVSAALFVFLFQRLTPKQAAWRGWWFGFGLFASGASWVYVSIHEFGYAPVPLAVFITFLFTGGLALTWLIFAYLYVRFIRPLPLGNSLGYAAVFVLCEWFRSWFLTGFPWLYLGYGYIDTPLAGWAPVTGVYGISFIVTLTGAAIANALMQKNYRQPLLIVSALLWLGGYGLQQVAWVSPADKPPLKIAMVQANISQAVKWDRDQYWPTLNLYNRMSQPLWSQVDIVIWPEAAVPGMYHNAQSFLEHMAEQANQHGSSLITGIPSSATIDGQRHSYNSIVALGNGEGLYNKQRLVPFGEYIPLEGLLRGLIQFFNLPMSAFSAGDSQQQPLQAAGISLTPLICYEVVYSELVSHSAGQTDMLLTISNDAWFGDSIGPLQHLEMAQMRALETGRYLIRSTGSGISAIVNERGHITVQGPQFKKAVIHGEAQVMQGVTPFARSGSWPIISLCLGLIASLYLLARQRR